MTTTTHETTHESTVPPPLGQHQILLAFSGLLLAMLLASLDQTIVATALPTVVGDLGDPNHLAWVVIAYLLASTAATPHWGKSGDLYSRKPIFLATIALFLTGSTLCGLGAFILRERRAPEPILPPRLFRIHPGVWAGLWDGYPGAGPGDPELARLADAWAGARDHRDSFAGRRTSTVANEGGCHMVENHGVQGYVVGSGAGVAGHGHGVMATRVSTGGALTLIELEVRDGPPWHIHTREEESFCVLDGSLRVYHGDDIFAAGPRSFVFLPRGISHRFDAVDGPATVLLIAVPGGLDEYFDELHQAADATSRAAVLQKYGIHASRRMDTVWRDDDDDTGPRPRTRNERGGYT